MKSFDELNRIAEATNDNVLDLMHDEFHNHENPAMRIFHDVLVDWSCQTGDIDARDEILMSMCNEDYDADNGIFTEFLVENIVDGIPRYLPQDEEELDKIMDVYNQRKHSFEDMQNKMVRRHGVEWLSADANERMRMEIEFMQKDIPPHTTKDIPPMSDEDNGYTDLPF